MKKVLSVLAAVVMLAAFSAQAEAVVINFDDLEIAGTNYTELASYSSDGFNFTSSVSGSGVFAAPQQSNSWYYGSANMYNNFVNGITTLAAAGGGLFTINSMDLHALYTQDYQSNPVTLSAYAADNSLLGTQSINVLGDVWHTINFSSDFENISYLRFSPQVTPYYSFDNLVLNAGETVVPEPASMALMLSGLLGVLGIRKRK